MRYFLSVAVRQVSLLTLSGTARNLGYSQNAANPFRIRTSAKCPRNSFLINTLEIVDLKSLRISTYKKHRGEVGTSAY
jgi:hypothetical protein